MAEFDLQKRTTVEAYQLVTRIVAPRPIALVSTLSATGAGNLAPFSYFMMGGSNPPSCVICPVNDRHGERKDTARNIPETGEYVINVVTRAMAERMNQCSFPYEATVDEFDKSGLTRAPAQVVKPPRVAESPIHLECRLHKIVRHGDGALASSYVIGEIVHVQVADDLLTDGLPDDAKIEFIGRLGADWYTHVTSESLFELKRPTGE
ncbi:MAG: flavin reductase family protein [Deltaproteobacteria bacterium]|nr:flavin reductase family protein [Deltaproteobacteria bacterium]